MESHSSGVEGLKEESGEGTVSPEGLQWSCVSVSQLGDLMKAALVTLKQRKGKFRRHRFHDLRTWRWGSGIIC